MNDKPRNLTSYCNTGEIPPWGLSELLFAFFLGFVVTPLGISTFFSTFYTTVSPVARLLFTHLAIYSVWLLIFVDLGRRHGAGNVLSSLGLRRDRTISSYLWDGFFCGGLILMMAWILGFLAEYFHWPQQQPYQQFSVPQMRTIATLAILIAPIMEELVFRGFLQSTLYRYTTPYRAVLATALLFTLFHSLYYGYWAALIYVGLMALILGGFRYATKSTIPGIIGHFINNAIAALILLR